MSLAIRILPETIRTVAYSAFVGGYQPIGNALEFPSRVIKFYNGTDADVYLSWDGVNNHEILPSKAFVLLDICSNKITDTGLGFFIAQNTQFWAIPTAAVPTVGNIYLSTYYGFTGN